jgi:hypothetical protein
MKTATMSFPLRTLPALAAVLLAIAPGAAWACTCSGIPEFEAAFAQSEAIFVGTPLSIEPVEDTYPSAVLVHFSVAMAWKGVSGNSAFIQTAASGASCGYEFVLGREYLVYADAYQDLEPGTFATHLCHRTHETYPNDPDLVRLGDPPVPALPATWGAVKAAYR